MTDRVLNTTVPPLQSRVRVHRVYPPEFIHLSTNTGVVTAHCERQRFVVLLDVPAEWGSARARRRSPILTLICLPYDVEVIV